VAAGKKQKREDQELWAAHRITWIGAGVNLGSAAAKAVAGVAAASPALLADAAHSLSDLLSDGVALWATKAARRPVSRHTPYGSGKFEALGAVGCSGMILAAGLSVGFHSLSCLPPALAPLLPPDAFTWLPHDLIPSPPPTEAISGYAGLSREQWFGAAAAASGLVAKEVLYRETLRIGNEIRSATLLANAWHHRTDAFSSVVAGVGLLGGALGVPVLDPAAGLIVAGMVTRVGIQMGRDNIAELTDTHAVDEGTLKAIEALALAEDGEALGVTGLRARRLGPAGLSVELRLQVPFHLSVSAAQQVGFNERGGWADGIVWGAGEVK
jgi:divalent metal cation (Fe/Co/Zn/Cd) transporter